MTKPRSLATSIPTHELPVEGAEVSRRAVSAPVSRIVRAASPIGFFPIEGTAVSEDQNSVSPVAQRSAAQASASLASTPSPHEKNRAEILITTPQITSLTRRQVQCVTIDGGDSSGDRTYRIAQPEGYPVENYLPKMMIAKQLHSRIRARIQRLIASEKLSPSDRESLEKILSSEQGLIFGFTDLQRVAKIGSNVSNCSLEEADPRPDMQGTPARYEILVEDQGGYALENIAGISRRLAEGSYMYVHLNNAQCKGEVRVFRLEPGLHPLLGMYGLAFSAGEFQVDANGQICSANLRSGGYQALPHVRYLQEHDFELTSKTFRGFPFPKKCLNAAASFDGLMNPLQEQWCRSIELLQRGEVNSALRLASELRERVKKDFCASNSAPSLGGPRP